MRKIIKGKVYDVDKAKKLATWERSNRRDFGYICETLYIKRTGEYFIAGEGGAQTKYREWAGENCWTGGSKITPITEQEARRWVEEHANGEYERIFGKVYEDGSMVIRTYSIPTYIAEKLKKEALKRGVSASQLLCDLVENI